MRGPIPQEVLCDNEISNMNIITPDGETYRSKMKESIPITFTWVDKKADLWVIGIVSEVDLKGFVDRFYDYVSQKYDFKAEIVPKQGIRFPRE